MILPKRIFSELLFAVIFFTLPLSAQEKRLFSLNELIPGGSEFARFYPRMPAYYQWYGDRLMRVRNDSVWEVTDPADSGKQRLLFTLSEIGFDNLDTIPQFTGITFPKAGEPFAKLHSDNGIATCNPEEKRVTAFFKYPERSERHKLSPSGLHMAFTRENNLYLLQNDGRSCPLHRRATKEL